MTDAVLPSWRVKVMACPAWSGAVTTTLTVSVGTAPAPGPAGEAGWAAGEVTEEGGADESRRSGRV